MIKSGRLGFAEQAELELGLSWATWVEMSQLRRPGLGLSGHGFG
jgi:hypothetical protein